MISWGQYMDILALRRQGSGDNHLLSLKHFHRIQIVDAATFIEKVKVR